LGAIALTPKLTVKVSVPKIRVHGAQKTQMLLPLALNGSVLASVWVLPLISEQVGAAALATHAATTTIKSPTDTATMALEARVVWVVLLFEPP
jgi:hypothetical protein